MTNKLLILSIFAAMSTASIHAQERARLKVNIPFSFHVGKTAMPAGLYNVQGGLAARGTLSVLSTTGAANVNIGTIPDSTSRPPVQGKLVFHKYGDDYFLYQVWAPNSTAIMTVPVTPQERELTARFQSPDKTILVARRP